jgi:pimeloyl-ACP methyl ester carboxylesterase
MAERQVPVANGRFEIGVVEEGSGPPLLFMHGISGLNWGDAMQSLAQRHTVIAPRHPGYGDQSQHELDSVHDLVYAYLDLLDALDLRGVPMVGHSLGGMIAAEVAATQPERFNRLVLLSPLGFYHPEQPTFDFFACTPKEMASAFFKDPESPAAQAAGDRGLARIAQVGHESPEGRELIEVYIERTKTLATAAKYLWPIPNRGLRKRIHRLQIPTLLLWGEHDRVVPPSYADDFLRAIPGAQCQTVDAGHELMLEQSQQVVELIESFVAAPVAAS